MQRKISITVDGRAQRFTFATVRRAERAALKIAYRNPGCEVCIFDGSIFVWGAVIDTYDDAI